MGILIQLLITASSIPLISRADDGTYHLIAISLFLFSFWNVREVVRMTALPLAVHVLALSQRKGMTYQYEPEPGQHRKKISLSLENTRLEICREYILESPVKELDLKEIYMV